MVSLLLCYFFLVFLEASFFFFMSCLLDFLGEEDFPGKLYSPFLMLMHTHGHGVSLGNLQRQTFTIRSLATDHLENICLFDINPAFFIFDIVHAVHVTIPVSSESDNIRADNVRFACRVTHTE